MLTISEFTRSISSWEGDVSNMDAGVPAEAITIMEDIISEMQYTLEGLRTAKLLEYFEVED